MARLAQSASSRKPAGPVIPAALRECVVEDWLSGPVRRPDWHEGEGPQWPDVMLWMTAARHQWVRARIEWARAQRMPLPDALRLLPRPERAAPRFRDYVAFAGQKQAAREPRTEPRRGWRG